jgi:hypothetical protein
MGMVGCQWHVQLAVSMSLFVTLCTNKAVLLCLSFVPLCNAACGLMHSSTARVQVQRYVHTHTLCTLLSALHTLIGVQVQGQIESSFAADPGAVIVGAPVDPADTAFVAPPDLPGVHVRLPHSCSYH